MAPFGGGKTQTAHEIQRRLAGSIICDPELLGFGLHRMMPLALRGDFQDLAAWRHGVFEVLDLTLKNSIGSVIVPMTVVESRYFRETVGRLRDEGHDVRHFALLAERSIMLRRLRERGLGRAVDVIAGEGAALRMERFAVSRLDLCLERLQEPEFAEQVWTDDLTIAQVADHIADTAGLSLTPNTDSQLRSRLRQVWIGATRAPCMQRESRARSTGRRFVTKADLLRRGLRANLGRLRWTTWNAREGRAWGVNWPNNCIPNCAQGTHFPKNVNVHAYGPNSSGIFTRLDILSKQNRVQARSVAERQYSTDADVV
jgi:hypothetical protein